MKNTEKSFETADDTGASRPIRTFGRRHGKKISAHQQSLVDNLLPSLLPEDCHSSHQNCPAILEIGFGAGEHLMHLARTYPDHIIIGAEPFMNGVASLLSHIYDYGSKGAPIQIKPEYKNIRIWPDDVRKFLIKKTGLFEKIYILHPDPWPKARHEKRRLFQTAFIADLTGFLVPGGQIILGTDHTDYFNWAYDQAKLVPSIIVKKENAESTGESGLNTRYMQKNKFGSAAPMYLVITRN